VTEHREHDHTLAKWTCGCDPTLVGLMEAAKETGNIAITVGHTTTIRHSGRRSDEMARTPHRTVRVEDELWDPAMAKAAAEGTTVSEVIRAALKRYLRQPGPGRSSSASTFR
jgi:hypothetical protein